MSDELQHIGMPRRSGRYPWGSGGDPYQRAIGWREHVRELKKEGLSDLEIAEHEGIKTTQLRARIALAKSDAWNAERNQAITLKDKGYSNVEIGKKMGRNESSIRNLLNPVLAERADITNKTAQMLKENVDKHRFIDIGIGIESHVGVSRTKLNNAVNQLEEEGYKVHKLNVDQVGIPGQFTIMKVLGTPDTEWKEIVRDKSLIKNIVSTSDDFGRSFTSDLGLRPIQHLSSDRIKVRYADENGSDRDGVIELRRGVNDLNLGKSRYAQVRIGVDGTHFLKGMAIYGDDLPDGVDVVFNTNKQNTGNKLDAMKKLKPDPDNPFGATIKREINDLGEFVSAQRGALNIVNEEGDWERWSKTISSQILSKQSLPLAKTQLNLALNQKKEEYDEIMSLTNPVVKKQLLTAFSDDCDSSSIHLKAAGLPRQANKIILPIPSLKENEVYAPTFNNGETVVLIRHPHGGTFEIPQLTVNNKSRAGKAILGNEPQDAIGIHPNVAKKLSGADFDGDTVIIIPNSKGRVISSESLKGLKNFDPLEKYKPYDGLRTIDGGTYNGKTREVEYGINPLTGKEKKPRSQTRQTKMGEVSNLITDMTIKGATFDELARAVKHSMVVIDSEKHHLDYKRSEIENGIESLSKRYQNGKRGGASTLISKASSEYRVDERIPRKAEFGGPIDPATGKKVYTKTGASYEKTIKSIDPITGKTVYTPTGKIIIKKTLSTKMAETEDARTLSSGRPIEAIYASYANELKGLANKARKNSISIKTNPRSPSAAKVYANEVESLERQLALAYRNKPYEREAHIYANSVIQRKRQANSDMDRDEIKKLRNQSLAEARVRTGAKKVQVDISSKEWEAIQAGAISPSKLSQILQNSDLDRIKSLATPRTKLTMTPTKVERARSRLEAGYTLSEVASDLGVSTSTLSKSLKG